MVFYRLSATSPGSVNGFALVPAELHAPSILWIGYRSDGRTGECPRAVGPRFARVADRAVSAGEEGRFTLGT
jgi:hypothetical protein